MTTLHHRILEHVRRTGPMPFEEFMAACLYDPEAGFFATGPLRSTKGGDFLTSPEVSPWFGRMIARFVAAERDRVDAGEPLRVVEVGAGSGSLLRSLLGPDSPVAGVRAHAVEASPAARKALADVLPPDRIHERLEELPARFTGVILANELLDDLPVALAMRSGAGWRERWVGAGGDRLGLVTVPARPEVIAWCEAHAGRVPEGGVVEVQLAASAWVAAAVGRLTAGAVLLVDYGGMAEELEPRRAQGTLRTYRRHHLGPDPLAEPGATDITADVNFTAMAGAAAAAGADVEVLRQDDFLTGLGLRDVLRDLRRRELALARDGDPLERLRLRAEQTDAATLLHPRGLGDFRVLVARMG